MGLVAGCGESAPRAPPYKTWPVQGRLLDSAGQPLVGGMIELVSEGSPPRTGRATCRPTESSRLRSSDTAGNRFTGAAEGEYRVTYIPVMSAEQTESPFTWPDPIRIEPRDNDLQLQLP